MPGMMKVTRGSGDGSVDIPRLRRALGTVPEYRFTITGALRLRHREVRGRHHLAEQQVSAMSRRGAANRGTGAA